MFAVDLLFSFQGNEREMSAAAVAAVRCVYRRALTSAHTYGHNCLEQIDSFQRAWANEQTSREMNRCSAIKERHEAFLSLIEITEEKCFTWLITAREQSVRELRTSVSRIGWTFEDTRSATSACSDPSLVVKAKSEWWWWWIRHFLFSLSVSVPLSIYPRLVDSPRSCSVDLQSNGNWKWKNERHRRG